MPLLSDVYVDGAWKGAKRCFIIGGGPSLRGFDWRLLENELTIGINAAFTKSPTIAFSEDVRFQDVVTGGVVDSDLDPKLRKLREGWPEYAGVKVFHNVQAHRHRKFFPGAYTVENAGRHEWSDSLKRGLCHGTNTGTSALNLADVLMGGEGTIYLLGFDMKGEDGRVAQFHDEYPDEWKGPEYVYAKQFLPDFEMMKGRVRTRVVNLNPDSSMDSFPKAEWKDEVTRWKRPMYVSFHTGGPYAGEADRLKQTLRMFGLQHRVVEMPDLGSWFKNVRHKPTLIKTMLDTFFESMGQPPIVFLDADARVMRYPVLFDSLMNEECDVAVHAFQRTPKHDVEPLAGTLYCSNNDKVREFVDKWIRALPEHDDDPYSDLAAFKTGLTRMRGLEWRYFRARVLPAEYAWIEDAMRSKYPDAKPVILHTQASRKHKK